MRKQKRKGYRGEENAKCRQERDGGKEEEGKGISRNFDNTPIIFYQIDFYIIDFSRKNEQKKPRLQVGAFFLPAREWDGGPRKENPPPLSPDLPPTSQPRLASALDPSIP